ncbi:MAG TPA: hypothetical protein VFK88_10595 [Gallionella sp.]|nr:hypothetical protein [Gallionella sp.]
MAWGIKEGRVVETPFGRISDAMLRAGIGKYHLQAMLLLVWVMFGKGFYLVGLFTASISIAMFYQWPLSRFLAWRKSWYKRYFYGHLAMSILVGLILPSQEYPGWGVIWAVLNLIFMYALFYELSDDIEDLMQDRVDFSETEAVRTR